MTEPAQLRLNIAPDLRDEFKATCLRTGVSMADQAARLITQFMAPQQTPTSTDLVPETDDEAVPQINANNDGADAPPSLDHKLDTILDSLDKAATRGNINWLSETLLRDAESRHALLGKSIFSARHQVRRWHRSQPTALA